MFDDGEVVVGNGPVEGKALVGVGAVCELGVGFEEGGYGGDGAGAGGGVDGFRVGVGWLWGEGEGAGGVGGCGHGDGVVRLVGGLVCGAVGLKVGE